MKGEFFCALLILVIALVQCENSSTLRKSNPLVVMALMSYTGNEPRDGKLCQAAMEIAINTANERPDILPDYNILPVFRDEAFNGALTVKNAFEFWRQYSSMQNGTTMAPIIVGSYVTGGCQRLGPTLHYFDLTEIGLGCSTPVFTNNRRIYPNLFRLRASGEIIMHPRLSFVTQIGRWNRIGILTRADSIFDVTMATMFNGLSRDAGIKVGIFEAVTDVTDNFIEALKASDVRIIDVDVSNTPSFLQRFLCQAYKFGITGSRYIFFTGSQAFTEPASLKPEIYPGCTREIVIEQYKYVFWIGWITTAARNNGPTYLGYDLHEFERKFDKYTNRSRTPDYLMRHRCHDGMLEAIVALDGAEKRLRNMSMTLSDYQLNPFVVAKVVNESIGKVDFVGVRVGRTKYTSRLEMDSEPLTIAYWTPEEGYFDVFLVSLLESSNGSTHVDLKQLREIPWPTPDKRPPKDVIETVRVASLVERSHFAAVSTVAACLSVLTTISLLIVKKSNSVASNSLKRLFPLKCLLVSACLLLNAASIVYIASPCKVSCVLRPFILMAGLSLLHVYLLFMVFYGRASIRGRRLGGKWKRKPSRIALRHRKMLSVAENQQIQEGKRSSWTLETPPSLKNKRVIVPNDVKMKVGQMICSVAAFPLLNIVIVLAWTFADPLLPLHVIEAPTYDPISDVYVEREIERCTSNWSNAWIITLVLLQLIPLGLAIYVSYDLRRVFLKASSSDSLVAEIKRCSLLTANTTTFFFATCLIILIIGWHPLAWEITISFAVLLDSMVAFLVTFYPLFEQMVPKRNSSESGEQPV